MSSLLLIETGTPFAALKNAQIISEEASEGPHSKEPGASRHFEDGRKLTTSKKQEHQTYSYKDPQLQF